MKSLLKTLVVVCGIACFLAGASLAEAAPKSTSDSVGFSISPMRFDLEVGPGRTGTYSIRVRNTDTVKTTYTVTKEDFSGSKSDPHATPVLLGGRLDSAISGVDWLVPATTSFKLNPGQEYSLTVKVKVPSGATGGHYAAIIVNGATRSIGDMTAQSRAAVLFLMNAGGSLPPEIVIDKITQPTKHITKVIYKNDGDTAVHPNGTINYRSPIGGGSVRVPARDCTTALPGGIGECTFETGSADGVGPIREGAVQLVTDQGTRAAADLPVEWAGSWSALLLPLTGLALLFAYFFAIWRRRRRRDDASDEFVGVV